MNHLFRYKHALRAKEPSAHPRFVNWANVATSPTHRIVLTILTTILTALCIFFSGWLVKVCYEYPDDCNGVILGAVVLSLLNVMFPEIADFFTSWECHETRASYEISLYAKIMIFALTNTVVVPHYLTPFTSIDLLLKRVFAIFMSEFVISNLFQLADLKGNWRRHYSAPRMATQETMDNCMEGSQFHIDRRYMTMMKILTLTLWYCVVFPGAFFVCSIILLIKFYVDRFSLMRSCKATDNIEPTIARINQRYFFPLALGIMTLASAYFWAGLHFDNVCHARKDDYFSNYVGWPTPNTEIQLEESTRFYKYCNQDIFQHLRNLHGNIFQTMTNVNSSAGDDYWMFKDQESMSRIYIWFSVFVFGCIALYFTISVLLWILDYFGVKHKSSAEGSKSFSSLKSKASFIPEVHSSFFPNPLIACPVKDITESEVFGWKSVLSSYEQNDLTLDAELLLRDNDKGFISRRAFSRTLYWSLPLSHEDVL